MGLKSKIKSWFYLDEDDYEEYEEEEYSVPKREERVQPKQNVVSLKSVKQSSKVILIEPKVFAEAQSIADHLKSRRAVVVNLQSIDREQARRFVDFLSGTVYAIGGDIQKVGSQIFLCVPDNVEVSGNISDGFIADENNDTRW